MRVDVYILALILRLGGLGLVRREVLPLQALGRGSVVLGRVGMCAALRTEVVLAEQLLQNLIILGLLAELARFLQALRNAQTHLDQDDKENNGADNNGNGNQPSPREDAVRLHGIGNPCQRRVIVRRYAAVVAAERQRNIFTAVDSRRLVLSADSARHVHRVHIQ